MLNDADHVSDTPPCTSAAEIVAAARTGEMLPFDKERRWSATKSETVLVDDDVHRPDLTIIPTLNHRGTGMIKTHVYGPAKPDTATLRAATRRWCAAYGAATGRVIWFTSEPPQTDAAAGTRILLKTLTEEDIPASLGRIRELEDLPRSTQDTFVQLAQQVPETGLGFCTGAGVKAASTGRSSPPSTTARFSERSVRSP
jgi:hypothetical protein